MQTEERDYYEVLGAEPSASAEQLRAAFREAVLRHLEEVERLPGDERLERRYLRFRRLGEYLEMNGAG